VYIARQIGKRWLLHDVDAASSPFGKSIHSTLKVSMCVLVVQLLIHIDRRNDSFHRVCSALCGLNLKVKAVMGNHVLHGMQYRIFFSPTVVMQVRVKFFHM
jgi:hypothetical protein